MQECGFIRVALPSGKSVNLVRLGPAVVYRVMTLAFLSASLLDSTSSAGIGRGILFIRDLHLFELITRNQLQAHLRQGRTRLDPTDVTAYRCVLLPD